MTHCRSFIRYLRKICLILLLTLFIIMLLHILTILFLHTYVSPWNIASSPTHAAVLVFLYYVIPLITLLFFYLIINGLMKLEIAHTTKKQNKRHTRKVDKLTQTKKKNTSKQIKKEPLQYSCYTPHTKSPKKKED